MTNNKPETYEAPIKRIGYKNYIEVPKELEKTWHYPFIMMIERDDTNKPYTIRVEF